MRFIHASDILTSIQPVVLASTKRQWHHGYKGAHTCSKKQCMHSCMYGRLCSLYLRSYTYSFLCLNKYYIPHPL